MWWNNVFFFEFADVRLTVKWRTKRAEIIGTGRYGPRILLEIEIPCSLARVLSSTSFHVISHRATHGVPLGSGLFPSSSSLTLTPFVRETKGKQPLRHYFLRAKTMPPTYLAQVTQSI